MIIDANGLLAVFDSRPSLYILEGAVGFPSPGGSLAMVKSVSPLEASIAFRSLSMAMAEVVAHERLPGLSADSMIMRPEFVVEAERRMKECAEGGEADHLFKEWKERVIDAILTLAKASPEMKTREALMEIGDRFRVSHVLIAQFVGPYVSRSSAA